MRRAGLLIALLAASPVRAAFEKGGLLESMPRSAALAGADLALPDPLDAAAGPAAYFPALASPVLLTGYGMTSEGGFGVLRVAAGGTWQGVGLAGSFIRRAVAGASERQVGIGIGLPVDEVPGMSFGAMVKSLGSDLGTDAASGVAADLSLAARLPSPAAGLELSGAVAAEDAFGSLDWDSGLEESPARQVRLGLGARWRDRLDGVVEGRLIRGPIHREGLWAAGAEYRFTIVPHPAIGEMDLATRLGWRGGNARTGAGSAGIGIGRGPVRIGYAVAGPVPGQGMLHTFAAGWRIEGFAGGAAPRAGPARTVTGGDAGAAVPETAMVRFDSPYRTLQIAIAPPRGFAVETWAVLVLDGRGEVAWSAEGNGLPPSAVEWNGTALDGAAAPAGGYECRLATRGPGAFRSFSAGSPFRLVRPPVRRAPEPDGPGGF